MVIRKIDKNDHEEALKLVLRVFMQFEAPEYSPEGVETFKNTAINNTEFLNSLTMFGAYEDKIVIGVIATRNNNSHIALFFVDGKYHRRGIGRKLFETVLNQSSADEITVNSSPYAVPVYHRLGFIDTEPEQTTNGIRYTPMKYIRKNDTDLAYLLQTLEGKDNILAYEALTKLEQLSEGSELLYPYTEYFVSMSKSDKYVLKVRGFRLLCKQAKWDNQNIINSNIEAVLKILDDEKPTVVRQALAALQDVLRYKSELEPFIKEKALAIDYYRYKNTMHGLIKKDIENLLSDI